MKKIAFSVLVIALLLPLSAMSQSKVNSYLKMIAKGKVEEVKTKMPELIANYPDEPGVKLLQAVLTEDGSRAVNVYKSIVKDFPNSEFADDAQWRIVQFYAIIGDTNAAIAELEVFRKRYPNSEFLAPASDVVRSAIGMAKYDYKKAHTAKAETKTPTKIEPAKASAAKPSADVKAAAKGHDTWGLQVGIYSTKAAAESEMKRFTGMKLKTEVKEKSVEGKKKFAVIIGNYSSIESAEKAKIEVEKKCKCAPIVFKEDK